MTQQQNKQQSISILVPMYNEAEAIPHFFPAIHKVMESVDVEYNIICVDDGSKDNTLELLLAQAEQDTRVQVVAFSRNFGKEAAMTAAVDYADGDAAIPIDADLQDPPELIIKMVEKWREGFDVVYAKRVSRDTDTAMKRSSAGGFYKVFNKLSQLQIPENVGDFRLMDRKVLDALRRLPEKDRFMKGLFCWPGFKNTTLEFERLERTAGDTKFNYWKLWNFALSGITSFSTMPIRFGVYLGLLVSFCAFIFGLWTIIKTVVMGVDVPGYASLMVVMLFLGGIQLFFMGLMGEYIGRIYMEVKNRPIYVVAQEVGFSSADKKAG
ncbi:putative glycosyltransferase [Thalassocella blandensis]|nr:putative glycosyltransferase [Thalassocella blandensis]